MLVSLFERFFQSFRLLLDAILDCSRHIEIFQVYKFVLNIASSDP